MKKDIFEIVVSRNNEKGAGIFEHILITLHNVYEEIKQKNFAPNFSFEISRIFGRIRFFVISPSKYTHFLKNQIYAHFNDIEIIDVGDYLNKIPDNKVLIGELKENKYYLYPIKSFIELQGDSLKDLVDPYSSLTSALNKTGIYSLNTIQINFVPTFDDFWKKNLEKKSEILLSSYSKSIKNILLEDGLTLKKFLIFVFLIFPKKFFIFLFSIFFGKHKQEESEESDGKDESIPEIFIEKTKKLGFKVSIKIASVSKDFFQSKATIKEIISTLGIFSGNGLNSFALTDISNSFEKVDEFKARLLGDNFFVLNSQELSGLVHLPTSYVKTPGINWVSSKKFEPPSNLPIIDPDLTDDIIPETELTPIGKTNFRGTNMSFGISPTDRRRHIYIIGKTGMGKSTLLENMIIDDIKKGRGVAVVDPHGDLAETIIGYIPKRRTNQVIIFDPSDTEFPIAFNMFEGVKAEHRSLVASGLIGIFKKIFEHSWGPRLEHILRNTILALLEYPKSTLMSIPLMLTSDIYRNKVVNKITDPVIKKFWTNEFAKMSPNQKVEASGPILNKVGQFLSSTILRNILGQQKNTFNIRWAMDNKKIIIVNLSKGKIGEDVSSLLGSMMVTKFQMDAMSRADIKEEERQDFYLYVDEFQNFATDSFVTILSEARKYKLNLVMANQYISQIQIPIKDAVFGNVGTTISFQVGYDDAKILKDALGKDVTEEDLMNLAKYNIYLKQLIDGMPSNVFSAITFPGPKNNKKIFDIRYNKILQVSRMKYAKNKEKVEELINKTMKEIEQMEEKFNKARTNNKNNKNKKK